MWFVVSEETAIIIGRGDFLERLFNANDLIQSVRFMHFPVKLDLDGDYCEN